MFCIFKLILSEVFTALAMAYSFIERTQDTGHLITELTLFEARLKRGRLDETNVLRAK